MKVKVCTWKTCKSRFSEYILTRLKSDIWFYWLKNLEIEEVNCLWNCKRWPNIKIDWKLEERVTPSKASSMIHKIMKNNNKSKK